MPRALAPEKRDAIKADLQAGMHCREAARAHGVAQSTVSKLAAELGISFERSQTEIATKAAVADMAAQRAATSARFLQKANELLDLMDKPFLAFNFGGRENTYEEHQFDRPPIEAQRNMITAAAIAFDKHLKQADFDNTGDQGSAVVDQWLVAVTGHGKLPDLGRR